MKFKHDGVEYDLIGPDTWTTLEAGALQDASGQRVHQLIQDAREYGPMGVHALCWLSLRRAGVTVEWDELELNWVDTVSALTGIERATVEDPSTASTPRSAAKQGGRPSRARSVKR